KSVIDEMIGGGGAAFADYRTIVYSAYYNAWIAPEELIDDEAVTEVRVVIARDGSIISADITGKSGKAVLDRSVERALRAVRQLPAFPEAAKDSQRTFKIRFNLKAKQSSG